MYKIYRHNKKQSKILYLYNKNFGSLNLLSNISILADRYGPLCLELRYGSWIKR